jgi:lipid-A-disaccharide synthase
VISGRALLTLAREGLRALASPLWILLYIPTARIWRGRTAAALAAPLPAQQELGTAAPIPCSQPHIFLSAGEASGEGHAVHLMDALDSQGLSPRWSCFGGQAMAEAGGDVLYPLSESAVMGVVGALRSLPQICRAYDRYERLLREDPPDLVVLVDYPGLHLVLAEVAKRRGIPVVHYIAPQYWAWAPWRMRRYRRCIHETLTILPFEVAYFQAAGISSTYVGNPLLDEVQDQVSEPAEPETGEGPQGPTLCLLPGSRSAEIQLNLPGMLGVASRLRTETPDLRVVLPHRDPRKAEMARKILRARQADFVEVRVGPPGPWLAASRAVLAKSGTGSLEACLHGTPTVVVYRVPGPLTLLASRVLLSVPWFSSPNLVAGRRIVPEFALAKEREWEQVTEAVGELLADGPVRAQCCADLAELRQRLGEPGASQRAAYALRKVLSQLTARGKS